MQIVEPDDFERVCIRDYCREAGMPHRIVNGVVEIERYRIGWGAIGSVDEVLDAIADGVPVRRFVRRCISR